MKKYALVAVVAFGISTLMPVTSFAGGHKGGSECSKGCHQEKKCKVEKLKCKMSMYWAYRDELELTEDQLHGIADVKHEAMKQMIRESAEVKAIKVDVKTQLWAPQIDVDKVNPLIDEKYAAKAKLAKTMVKALADAQAILTDKQRMKMKEIKVDRYINESGILGSDCAKKNCPIK